MKQYLFDREGNLLSVVSLKGDSVTGWNGELPPGYYTVVLWGNPGEDPAVQEVITANGTGLGELTLSSVTAGVPPGYRRNTGRLYFGTMTFEVENGKSTRRRIYLSHAHAALSITVRWMVDAPPDGGTYRMRMKGIPAIYGFTGREEITTPGGDGVYTIPRIGGAITYHEAKAAMNFDGEVTGQFITFRYTSATHQMWSLWRDNEQIIRELDLSNFFRKLPMDMDTNMEQEFDLIVTVYEDKIIVTQGTAADWDEGGSIG